jgi:hypothetical protein
MMTSVTNVSTAALEQADKPAQFTTAYTKLTDACNTCHQTAEVGISSSRCRMSPHFPTKFSGRLGADAALLSRQGGPVTNVHAFLQRS